MEEQNWGSKRRKLDDVTNDDKSKEYDLVSRVDNHIYFYDYVSKTSALKFLKYVDDIDLEQQVKLLKGEITSPKIHVHISSGGGSLTAGFSMASKLVAAKSETVSYCEGFVASAATLPFVVCDSRRMQKYSYILIHQLSTANYGTYESFKDNQENLDQFMNMLIGIYTQHTQIPERRLRSILKHDLVINPEQCKKDGIIDEIC